MRVEEITVADDIPATPVADGQGADLPGATPPAGAGAPAGEGTERTDLPGSQTQNDGANTPDGATVEVIDESTLVADLEETPGEYAPPGDELDTAGEALAESRVTEDEAHDTIVALENYFLLCKEAIDNKTCSMESLQLIRLGIEPYLKEGKFVTVAMEGREGADIVVQHQLALEGIKESIKSALHSVHTAHSASADNIKMIFTSIESDVKRYEAGLKKAVEKFDAFIKDNPKEDLHIDLHILQNFFNLTGKESGKTIAYMLRDDEKVDAYVLTKFSVEVEKQLESLTSAIGGEKTFAGLLSKVLKLKHPVELFDKRLLSDAGGSLMLGGYHATVYQAGFAGYSHDKYAKLSRLDQLSSSARVLIRQADGNARRAMLTSISPIHFPVEGALSEILKVPAQQIREVANAASQYLKNIEFFLQVLKSSTRAYDQALEKYLKFEAEDVNHKQADQVFDYLDALEDGITTTCRHEVTRALKAVFYCIALVNRATFVNK
jgi:hypothetical protein